MFDNDSFSSITWSPSINSVSSISSIKQLIQCPKKKELFTYLGSLTLYMEKLAGDRSVEINVLKQSEYQNINSGFVERIIQMSVDNTPWLYARSIFNNFGIKYLGDDLKNLGNGSLGLLLIKSYPDITRSNFEYGFVNGHVIRRSLFKLNHTQTVFSLEEVFLPGLLSVI